MITRDWIRNDAVFYTENEAAGLKVYSRSDLCEFINYWKIKFLDLGAKRGDKIGISMDNSEIHYYAMLFASFELGMKVVTLHRPSNENECSNPRSNAYLPLDIFVYFNSYLSNPKISTAIRHYRDNSKITLAYGKLEWETLSGDFRSIIETPILAQPDDELFCCTSSGTVDDPKLISYTHKYLFDLCLTNWRDLGYLSTDKIMHLASLNHGGMITLLLPSLAICKEHYFMRMIDPNDQLRIDFLNICVKQEISRIICSSGSVIEKLINAMHGRNIKLPDTTIMMLSFIDPYWVPAVKEGYLRKIESIFGCTEIGGPVFIPSLTCGTENFNPLFLGKPINGFFKTEIIDGRIHANGHVFDDIVEEKDDGVYFISKNRLRKINDVDINPIDVYGLMSSYTARYLYEIYVDEVRNRLFIITSDEVLIEMGYIVENLIESFYFGNVPTNLIYEPNLPEASVTHKADRDKLAAIVERNIK
jgi:acyl-coenzyme A synthetase/AMP-(fatty) acid ligase